MSQELRWFKITLDATGKVVSCLEVPGASATGASVVYVQAATAKAAERAALNSYMREVMRRRRAELDKAGKCRWCGRFADRGTKRCSVCLERDSLYSKRHQAKIHGKAVEPLDRRVATAERKAAEQQVVVKAAAPSLRLDLLIEVQRAWIDNPRVAGFTQWLERQIAAARGRKVA